MGDGQPWLCANKIGYVDFHLYRDGNFITSVSLAKIENGKIVPSPENFSTFTNLLTDFCTHIGQTIKSSQKLAQMMAGKARLLSEVIGRALTNDQDRHEDSTLKDQMAAFREILIHDITPKGFADVYAQTICYGMFAARLHDPTLPTFSRQEAAELIPKSNPFLRKLFGYIAGPDLDDRIKWIVDSLVEIFLACNVEEILSNYGKATKMEDPIIHFYETFLSEYDPQLRKARGVWYTPAPVVNFIVRAVDDILKSEFELPMGLADTSKTKIKVDVQGKKMEREVHKVQILDPATGTGTFLAETIKLIHKKFEGQQGIWSNYVETHLLPRLNGFELLMASYAMAHLKLDLLLTETGYKPTRDQRFRVYLTNSLEEYHPDTGTLFANWLSTEANEANHIKRDSPVMCVIGNPPYSGISSNNGEWISKLIEDYKYVDGVHINERKHWLNDDYVKFIRYGQHYIEKNGSGVLAFINPHGFLDNPTFRGMRWHLLKTFDNIFTIDLHGNGKKRETGPDGSADINVFDIMQGVSINIFVKTGKKKSNELGRVFHFDLFGKREMKYDFLSSTSLASVKFLELKPEKPFLFFVRKNNEGANTYDKGFRVDDLFSVNVTGIVTARDSFVIDLEKATLAKRMVEFSDNNLTDDFIRRKFFGNKAEGKYLPGDSRGWKMAVARKKLQKFNHDEIIQKIAYRLFDDRYIYYSNEMVDWGREKFMYHFIDKDNLGIDLCRQLVTDDYSHIFITNKIVDDSFVSNKSKERGYVFPLYLYPTNIGQQTTRQTTERTPNLNAEIVQQIATKLGLTFVPEKFPSAGGVAESRGGISPSAGGVAEGRGGISPSAGGVAEGRGGNLSSTDAPSDFQPGRNTRNYMDLPYNPLLKERARALRKAGNLAEVLFWNQVKNKQFKGYDFDRQKIIGNYIADFYCTNCNVVVEIDGSSHDEKQEYDAARDAYLQSLGLTVIHVTDMAVKEDLNGVMEMLVNHPALKGTPPEEGNLPLRPSAEPVGEGNFAPIDILDYIYAVLHSPTYREKYKEFLKIDFPRVPYPKDVNTFWKLVQLGGEIRQIHLLESPEVNNYITQYPIDGDNVVGKIRFEENYEITVGNSILHIDPIYPMGRVYINDTQYFEKVPRVAWEFYIGGYQPAQKWLKDRKDRKLEFEDILHYQKIILALTETDRLMKEIDQIAVE